MCVNESAHIARVKILGSRPLFVKTTPIYVLNAVGQEFVDCNNEKTNGK